MQQKAQCNNAVEHGDEGSERKSNVSERAGLARYVYVCNALPDHPGWQVVGWQDGFTGSEVKSRNVDTRLQGR